MLFVSIRIEDFKKMSNFDYLVFFFYIFHSETKYEKIRACLVFVFETVLNNGF